MVIKYYIKYNDIQYIMRGTGKINRDGHPTALLLYIKDEMNLYI